MNTHDPGHDRTADLLSAALSEEAAGVETRAGALQEIQRRTSTPPARTRAPWVWAAGGAAIATAAVITAVVLVSGNEAGTDKTPAASAPTSSVAPAPDVTLTLTYFGPNPGNPEGEGADFGRATEMPRLFTETHTAPGIGQPADFQAVHEFLTSEPIDPDYSTGWPSGIEVEAISTADGITTVELRGDADLEAPNALDEGQRTAAIQAFVKTVGGSTPVAFVYNDEPLRSLFGIDISAPVKAMSDDDSRAWISIDNLTEGQSVSNPVSVEVSGNVFEGNVSWSLIDGGGSTVDEGYVTTSMGSWTTASVELGQLEAGTYTFKAYEISAADGDEINVDTKTFTVN